MDTVFPEDFVHETEVQCQTLKRPLPCHGEHLHQPIFGGLANPVDQVQVSPQGWLLSHLPPPLANSQRILQIRKGEEAENDREDFGREF